MAVHFVTGKLGGGKTLVSVGRIKDYLLAGKKVATNLDLNLEYLIPRTDKNCQVFRIPDKPTVQDLEAIGYGTRSKRDEDFGLLVLDELGTWLNSRTYQKDKDRQAVIDWFLHARKFGWDVFLIVQDPDLLDKQVRISLGEHTVVCRRTDRIPLPVVGFLFKLIFGKPIKLPRVHVGSVFYGEGLNAIKVDTWAYRGNHLFKAYDTAQVFEHNENRIAQYIPPALLNNKRFAVKNRRFYMRMTKIYFKRFKTPLAFGVGLVLNFIILAGFLLYNNTANANVPGAGASSSSGSQPAGAAPVEYEFVKLSYADVFSRGYQVRRYFVDGAMYDKESLPGELVFRAHHPYLKRVAVKKDEKKKSDSAT